MCILSLAMGLSVILMAGGNKEWLATCGNQLEQ